jgi:hypothetical protein
MWMDELLKHSGCVECMAATTVDETMNSVKLEARCASVIPVLPPVFLVCLYRAGMEMAACLCVSCSLSLLCIPESTSQKSSRPSRIPITMRLRNILICVGVTCARPRIEITCYQDWAAIVLSRRGWRVWPLGLTEVSSLSKGARWAYTQTDETRRPGGMCVP